MVFLGFGFAQKEWQMLFLKFYRDFDRDENMFFDEDEMI